MVTRYLKPRSCKFELMKIPYRLKRKIEDWFNGFIQWISSHARSIIYCLIALGGIAFIVASFLAESDWKNVFSGVGTGAFSSLIVSLIINHATDRRIKQEKEDNKNFVFSKMLVYAYELYSHLIYNVNEFSLFSGKYDGQLYGLYDNFDKYNDFEKVLKKIEYDTADEELKNHLNKLFDFPKYRIMLLFSEIQYSTKRELYLQGVISQTEYNGLINNYSRDTYLKTVNCMNEFWDGKIIDYHKCIRFLRMNLYVCSNIISIIGNKRTVVRKEEIIEEDLNDRYFNEVEVYTQRYIEWEMEQAEEMAKYYEEHPELLAEMQEAWEAEENQTPTEKRLLALNDYILGISWDERPVDVLLQQLDPNEEQVKKFFGFKETKNNLRRNRKIYRSINKIYGKSYLKDIWKNAQ